MAEYGIGTYGAGPYSADGAGAIAEWGIQWRGALWGYPASNWALTSLNGWNSWTMRGSNVERPARHGSFPGLKRINERVIEAELTAMADDWTMLPALRAICAYDEDPVEEELVIWAGDAFPMLVHGRLERQAIPTDHEWSVGHHRAVLQWTCSDPRRYSITESTSLTIGLPSAGPVGLNFPLTFPLAFGSGGSSNSTIVANAGDVATWPIFTITGPVTGPVITNSTTGQKLQFSPSFTVGAGQTLVIDTDQRAVTLDGVSRSGELVTREWFPLPPARSGSTTITFSGSGAYSPSAGLVAKWRDAYS